MIPREKINKYYEDYIKDVSSFLESDKSENFDLGKKIKSIREKQSLSIDQIASKTGFEKDFLIQIESGKVNPPLSTIIKLSKALNTMLSKVISDTSDKKYSVVRVSEHKIMPRKASQIYSYIPLSNEVKDRHMDSFIVKLLPSKDVEFTVHEGEEFVYVLGGEVKIFLEDKVEVLNIGDTIYYQSNVPHFITSNNDSPAIILAVIYNG